MFEIQLANGKSLKTERADEVANFYQSRGESIAPAPQRKQKKHKKGRKLAKAG